MTVRSILVGLFALVAALAPAQQGTYRSGASSASWTINEHHTLLWDGAPYLPIGVRVDGNAPTIARATAAGIRDFVVDLPSDGTGWQESFQALASSGSRFLLGITSLAPTQPGFVVEPQLYRVADLKDATTFQFDLPGCSRALALLVRQRDRSIVRSWEVPAQDGKLSVDLGDENHNELVLLVYPLMTQYAQPDYWEAFDAHRDRLLASLSRLAPGAGLRGILNPFGTLVGARPRSQVFVPDSPTFRSELQQLLIRRYRTLDTALRAWGIAAPDLKEFSQMARLVPLWSGQRGVERLWDPTSGHLYLCEARESSYWGDLDQVVAEAAARRMDRLVLAVRKVADVPLLCDFAGWQPMYDRAAPTVDGLAFRASNHEAAALASAVAQPLSSVLRWKRPGWLIASDISSPDLALSPWAEPIDMLSSAGARGWFFRAPSAELATSLAQEATARSTDGAASQYSPRPLFYPINAAAPAASRHLGGGVWWLPSPWAGSRLDLGGKFHGYRTSDGARTITALWVDGDPIRTRLRTLGDAQPQFTTYDGVDRKPKKVRGGWEVLLNDSPLVIEGLNESPIPDECYTLTVSRFTEMKRIADELKIEASVDRMGFDDGVSSFERQPEAAFQVMRLAYWNLTLRLSSYVWMEAETPAALNLADPIAEPGCSGSSALAMRRAAGVPGPAPFAEYRGQLRSTQPHEIWVAMKVPAGQTPPLTVRFAGETFEQPSGPEGAYGNGYGWYYYGTVRSAARGFTVSLLGRSDGMDVEVDAVLLVPGSHKPTGPFPPELPLP